MLQVLLITGRPVGPGSIMTEDWSSLIVQNMRMVGQAVQHRYIRRLRRLFVVEGAWDLACSLKLPQC